MHESYTEADFAADGPLKGAVAKLGCAVLDIYDLAALVEDVQNGKMAPDSLTSLRERMGVVRAMADLTEAHFLARIPSTPQPEV